MKNQIKYNRFMLLLAALLFTTIAQAQIKVIYFKNFRNKTLLETYSPGTQLHPDRSKLIAELQVNIKKVTGMANAGAWKGLAALDDRIVTESQILFYYKDIANDTITLYVDKTEGGQVAVNHAVFGFNKKDEAKRFAENLFHIQQTFRVDQLKLAEKYEKKLAEFQIIAQAYHEQVEKPVITEEQRKYIVQANALNNEKNYSEALKYFEKATGLNATAYPAAYYNMALIAAQIEDYMYAVFNMKKYLLLVPDAPDARAAQDKIYEWEAKL